MVGTPGVACRARCEGLWTSVADVLAVLSGIRAGHSGTRRKLRLVTKLSNVTKIKSGRISQGPGLIMLLINK